MPLSRDHSNCVVYATALSIEAKNEWIFSHLFCADERWIHTKVQNGFQCVAELLSCRWRLAVCISLPRCIFMVGKRISTNVASHWLSYDDVRNIGLHCLTVLTSLDLIWCFVFLNHCNCSICLFYFHNSPIFDGYSSFICKVNLERF